MSSEKELQIPFSGTVLGNPPKVPIKHKKRKRKNKKHTKMNDVCPCSTYAALDLKDDLVLDEEQEDKHEYKKGGYHRVKIGDVFKKRYKVIKKLGWGNFSTVWLCDDLMKPDCQIALKIVKSASNHTEAALDEIKLLRKISYMDTLCSMPVVHMLDNFTHRGPHGNHVCLVFEVLGKNLLSLIRVYDKGLPISVVKIITKQLLVGLDFLHSKCKIIHTDLKPENILLQNSFISTLEFINIQNDNEFSLIDVPEELKVKIADFGNACWVDKHFTNDIQTRQYRAPEAIFKRKFDAKADIWSLGCIVFELATGDVLFDPERSREFTKTEDHLLRIMELLGKKIPENMIPKNKFSKEFMKEKIDYWGLDQVLIQKYKWDVVEAEKFAEFLLLMLELRMEDRVSARVALKNIWLE